MKNIDLLPISAEAKKRIKELALQYRRYGSLVIEITSFDNNRLIVRAEQKNATNGSVLNKKEIENRVRELFSNEIPEDWKLTISAVDFDRSDIDNINTEWIKNTMLRLDIKAKHIETRTGIDKATLSTLLSGNKELTKWHKVALYYFFKYVEISPFK